MKRSGVVAAFLFVILFGSIYLYRKTCTEAEMFQRNEGYIFGTTYHIVYGSSQDLQSEIDEELRRFDASLSPFNKTSVISRVNNNTEVEVDEWFRDVFNRSVDIYKLTDGAFDPTVSPLINAWGFGFDKKDSVTQQLIDSLLPLVGMDKVKLINNRVVKNDARMSLNFSAIAKGYACDVVASLLKKKGVRHFMVEIGGEIVVAGKNPEKQPWRVGVSKPMELGTKGAEELEEILHLSNVGLATSGNYRNFYYKDGRRVAHTINPKTGYPAEHSLLSATVIAPDCMTADALATAFMVMGVERSKTVAESLPDVEVFLIYTNGNDSLCHYASPGTEKYMGATVKDN